jgi:hypothetical protein
MKRRPLITAIDLAEMRACGGYPPSLKWLKRKYNRRMRLAAKRELRREV